MSPHTHVPTTFAIEDENDAAAFATAASVWVAVRVELLRVTRPAEMPSLEEAEHVMSRAN